MPRPWRPYNTLLMSSPRRHIKGRRCRLTAPQSPLKKNAGSKEKRETRRGLSSPPFARSDVARHAGAPGARCVGHCCGTRSPCPRSAAAAIELKRPPERYRVSSRDSQAFLPPERRRLAGATPRRVLYADSTCVSAKAPPRRLLRKCRELETRFSHSATAAISQHTKSTRDRDDKGAETCM